LFRKYFYMEKITKSKIREFIKYKLSNDQKWSEKALLKIFEFQTKEEKSMEQTTDHNGVGFTGIDGELLSSFAKQLERRGYLSPKQLNILFKKMPKYWAQIIKISDKEKLDAQVINYLATNKS
jgi:hypothetical protein